MAEGTRAVVVVGQIVAHVEQAFEILLVVVLFVDNQLALVVGGGIGIFAFLRFVGQVAIALLDLQERILVHLRFDAFLERLQRQLQNLHRLDHPRCKHLLLSEFLL